MITKQIEPESNQTVATTSSIFRDPFQVSYDEIVFGETIGKGGYGVVYQASWHGQWVAAKVGSNSRQRFWFQREIEMMKKINALSCPQLLALRGYTVDENDNYVILSELLLSINLKDLLKSQTVSWVGKLRCMREISLAIATLHANDIIHRDIKSTNVLVTNDCHFKVCDFAFAAQVGDGMYLSNVITGSLPWMAPECLHKMTSKKSDMWALGMVFWEILTNCSKEPYEDVSENSLRAAIDAPKINWIPAECPPTLSAFIRNCWFYNPNERPTAEEAVHVIDELMEEPSATCSPCSTQ